MTRFMRDCIPSATVWRPLAPFAALFVLLLVFAIGGMLVIAYEADRSDATRAREAVIQTFQGILTRLASAADMNAATSPIAEALSAKSATPASAYEYFNFTNSDALGYYGVIVLNPDGSAFAGTLNGLPWTGASLNEAAGIAAQVAGRLPVRGARTVQTLVRNPAGRAMAIAVANIDRGAGGVPSGRRDAPRRLAMLAPIDEQIVPKMLPTLGVENFRMAAANTDANAVTIPIDGGSPISFVWQPRTPGRAAVARWAPVIAVLLIVALVMLAYAGQMNTAATRALEELAHRDSLTGLANRAAFRDELDRRLARGDGVAVGMIDLNGFKTVNDLYGHPVGDAMLQAIATELARSVGQNDFVARLGGDEFAWVSDTSAAAIRLSDAFADRLARPLPAGEYQIKLGAAIGIAEASSGSTASTLMALADSRLYTDKYASIARRRLELTQQEALTENAI